MECDIVMINATFGNRMTIICHQNSNFMNLKSNQITRKKNTVIINKLSEKFQQRKKERTLLRKSAYIHEGMFSCFDD